MYETNGGIDYCGKSVLSCGLQLSYCPAFCCAVVTDPLGDVLSFLEHFEQLYGNSHPEMYRGTYSQVSLYRCLTLSSGWATESVLGP